MCIYMGYRYRYIYVGARRTWTGGARIGAGYRPSVDGTKLDKLRLLFFYHKPAIFAGPLPATRLHPPRSPLHRQLLPVVKRACIPHGQHNERACIPHGRPTRGNKKAPEGGRISGHKKAPEGAENAPARGRLWGAKGIPSEPPSRREPRPRRRCARWARGLPDIASLGRRIEVLPLG